MEKMKEVEISLKVVIDREKKRVVFAEAGSDFVDMLFSFLTLPMGTIVRLLANRSDSSHQPANIGSFNNLYRSVANLDAKYFAMTECKDMLLNTRSSAEALCRNLKIDIGDTKSVKYFICEPCFGRNLKIHIGHTKPVKYVICEPQCFEHVYSTYSFVKCKNCGRFLKKAVQFNDRANEGIFVMETSSFVIRDDLSVIPNTPGSTLGILETSGIKDFSVLEENTLKLGSSEILDMLGFSFGSKTPLSDIYFGKKRINLPVPIIQSRIGTEGSNAKKMTVKVCVQKSNNRILFAYSSEDFIELLFSLLTIPVGKVFSLLTNDQEPIASIENTYRSVIELNVSEYLKSQKLKDMLLDPKLPKQYLCSKHIFPLEEEAASNIFIKLSPENNYYLTSAPSTSWSRELTSQTPKGEGGFVRGPTKFMVTDELVVTPLSSMSCFTFLNSLQVPPTDIEEQVINIGLEEALNLLMAALTSSSALNNGLKSCMLKIPKREV